ncbi:aspartate/glutamate racemase family protein [uncultured Roseobacter sp.]|uniref:aspartate/glutamate racemase family protein n=1 Tax=uncultured Roseobacter sp. TaxID=114847 RepID=UPI00263508F6|nr:aspartate/glutamate racemase family protein [uncultured Roseobacter sp.]
MAHIRVVTPVIPTGLTKAEDFEGILATEDTVDFVEIDRGPASIESGFDEMLASAGTVAKIIEAEAAGVDAVVIDCMDDPGLRAGRESVSIPVLGPGEASMNLACMLGHRFSVLSVLANMRVLFETHARLYGAWDKYASTRSVEIPVRDLHAQSDLLKSNLLEQALLALTQDGADTIILGCTGMLGVAHNLQTDLQRAGWDVPVIDPIPVTIRLAKLLVQSGISHSKAVYPTPRKKLMQGYDGSALEAFRGS